MFTLTIYICLLVFGITRYEIVSTVNCLILLNVIQYFSQRVNIVTSNYPILSKSEILFKCKLLKSIK